MYELGSKQRRTSKPRTYLVATEYSGHYRVSGCCRDEARAAYAKLAIRSRPRLTFRQAINEIKSCKVAPEEKFKTGPKLTDGSSGDGFGPGGIDDNGK